MTKAKKFDLEPRTAKFAVNVIKFCRKLRQNQLNDILVKQLLRSTTSIGANYAEANGAISRQDFKNKICLCRKEAKETMYWLQLVAETDPLFASNCRQLWKEAQEQVFIFSAIIRTTKKNLIKN